MLLPTLTLIAVIAVLIAVLRLTKSVDKMVILFTKFVFDRQEERKHDRQAVRDRAVYLTEMERRTGDNKRR